MAQMRYDNLYAVLEEYGTAVAEKYRDKISAAGKDASGELGRTVHSYIDRNGEVITLWLSLQDYWKYLERGTRLQGPYKQQGRRPPLKPFIDWVRAKSIPLRGKKIEQVAWAVATSVWKHGTKPFWFLRDTLAEFPDIDARVQEAIKRDMEVYFSELLNELQ